MPQQRNHAVIITNRNSSHYSEKKLDREVLDPLNRASVGSDILDRPDEYAFYSTIRENSYVIVCGGDGTTNLAAKRISSKKDLSDTLLIPRPFGYANDFVRGVYGNSNTSLDNIIKLAEPKAAYTIEAIIQKDGEERIIRALGYAALGASAEAAKAINEHKNRDKTGLGSILHATHSLATCEPFEYLDSENNRKEAIEILAINYLMAGFLGTKENCIFKPEFALIETDKLRMIGKCCLGIFGMMEGEQISSDQEKQITTISQTVFQYDGEYIDIKPDTTVNFRVGPHINVACIPHTRY
jgi:diacylglycerol kinase family enzyme